MLLSDAARERGGLGGGVLPMCERMFREFMLWSTPCTAANDYSRSLIGAIPVTWDWIGNVYAGGRQELFVVREGVLCRRAGRSSRQSCRALVHHVGRWRRP